MILSVPSYMIPDAYAANVRFLAQVGPVKNVELLFYMWDDVTEALFRGERDDIRENRGTLRFSVHLPDRLQHKHELILELTRGWTDSYVVHPPDEDTAGFLKLLNGWREKYGDIFYLENLIGREFLSLLPELPGIPLCIDTGHLLVNGLDPAAFIAELRNPVRELHLHGLAEGKDHHPFTSDEPWFRRLFPFLRTFEGLANLEVFHYTSARRIAASLYDAGLIPEPLPHRDLPPPPVYDPA